MITRLEVDGFKSFADFAVDIPVLAAVVGPNASGKSNLFDAMALLARLVTRPVSEALAQGRGRPDEQWRRRGDGSAVDSMKFAVELLLDADVRDAFGTQEHLPHTRMRYEVVLERREDATGVLIPFVVRESAAPIAKGDDRWAQGVAGGFADAHLVYGASRWKVLVTEEHRGRKVFSLKGHRGANSLGRSSTIPAEQARATVLSGVTTAPEFPLLLAVRQEIARWRVLQLEPSALRMPSAGLPDDHLTSSGSNIAWVLELIRRSAVSSGTPGLDALVGDLVRIIQGFTGIEIVSNPARGQWELVLHTRDDGPPISARIASDGTLRLLALLAALYETGDPGVLCFEEPENGINPRRLTQMLDVLRDLVTDPTADDHEPDDELVQLLVSSHSPLLPLHLRASELLVLDTVTFIESSAVASRISRVRRVLDESPSSAQLLLGDDDGWKPLSIGAEAELTGITRQDAERLVHQG